VAAPLRAVPAAGVATALGTLVPGPGTPEEVALDAAPGRVCARDETAPWPLPPAPVARVDGYCLADPAPGLRCRITARSLPGGPTPAPPAGGTACFVMTGAPLPPGVEAVVPREGVTEAGDTVEVTDPATVPAVAAGARVAAGAVLARAGDRLDPVRVGRLADFGRARVAVFPHPTVDLLPVGSELADPAAAPAPTPGAPPPSYDSNAHVLAALVRAAGGVPRILPPVPDDPEAVAAALGSCTGNLIVATGGTARGAADHTAAAAGRAGFRLALDGLECRPGRTARILLREGRVLISLPGSPGAVAPLFALLVGPALGRLAGRSDWAPSWRTARLDGSVAEPRPTAVLSHAVLTADEGAFTARPGPAPGNGFALLPQGEQVLAAGEAVDVLWGESARP